MGSERAAIMMNLVPPVGWGEVATRTDLVALGNGLRGEMSVLRSELLGERAVLRTEMKAARAELLFKLFFGMVINNAILVILVLAVLKFA